MSRRQRSSLPAVWGWPLSLAIVTLLGLVSALIGGAGIWLWLSWMSLALPLLVIATRFRNSRKRRPHHARSRPS